MDVVAGTPVTLWADFLTPTDDLVVPDVGSVSYSLHDGASVRLVGPEALTPEAEATGVSIALDELVNALPVERHFDHRTVVVSWMADGRSGSRRLRYRIIPFPLYDVTPDTVRDVVGVASDELPDTSIDLFTAYLYAGQALGAPGRARLDQALTAGDLSTLTANRLIAYTAVELMLPALGQRILQAKTDGTLKSERIKGLDLNALAAAVATRRALDIGDLLGTTIDQLAAPTFLVLTTPAVDPVTGAAPA